MGPTVDSADWSEVFVISDRGTFLNMAQTEFSGHLIGMIIAHVGDMLLADDKGVLSRGKRTRTVPDDMKPGGFCFCDKTRPSLWRLVARLPVCPEPDKRELRMRPVGRKGNNQRPLVVRPKAHCTNCTMLEGLVRNCSDVRPRSTRWYMLVYPDSALYNAEAHPDEDRVIHPDGSGLGDSLKT